MNTKAGYSEREWEEIASFLSNERDDKTESINRFLDEQGQSIKNYWMEMESNRETEKVDIDRAWNALYSRLEQDRLLTGIKNRTFRINTLVRVAAVAVILIGLTITGRLLLNDSPLVTGSTVVESLDSRNRIVELQDGSRVFLNRESELVYPERFNSRKRKVKLYGEAYFEIATDTDRPFIIEAGDANVEVLGTSFNVITSNANDDVEVYVTTGKVRLSSSNGKQQLVLEPGFVGTLNNDVAVKDINEDLNYLAWNTEILTFDGNTLEEVFNDLKEVYALSVEVKDEDILDHRLTTTFDKNSPDTIIRLICTTFNLKYDKTGDTYYLER